MKLTLGRVVILVEDYDAAFAFYEKNFFCTKLFDMSPPDGQRYLHVGLGGENGAGIWFMKTTQADRIGQQTAGQPTIVLYTDDIHGIYAHLQANGVNIIEKLVETPESKFFHCLDLYGNRITVVQL